METIRTVQAEADLKKIREEEADDGGAAANPEVLFVSSSRDHKKDQSEHTMQVITAGSLEFSENIVVRVNLFLLFMLYFSSRRFLAYC